MTDEYDERHETTGGADTHDVSTRSVVTDANGSELIGERAIRTRNAILEASRALFLERGFAGTRINNITDACGISRAGFYTYFKDKHDVVTVLGKSAYSDILAVIGEWDDIPHPCSLRDVQRWVQNYFAFLDINGAFISAARSAPIDDEFRTSSRRMMMRVAFLLGTSLRSRQIDPTEAPEALGLATLAILDNSWSYLKVQQLPVDESDMIRAISESIMRSLNNSAELPQHT